MFDPNQQHSQSESTPTETTPSESTDNVVDGSFGDMGDDNWEEKQKIATALDDILHLIRYNGQNFPEENDPGRKNVLAGIEKLKTENNISDEMISEAVSGRDTEKIAGEVFGDDTSPDEVAI